MKSHGAEFENRWYRSLRAIKIAICEFIRRLGSVAGWLVLIVGGNSVLAAGDVLVLEHGGQIVGRWENRDKLPEDNYVFALPEGGQLVVSSARVQQILIGQGSGQPSPGDDRMSSRWTHGTHSRESRGYVRHGGRWRTPQDVQLIEEREELQRRQKQWLQQLSHWRGMLATPQVGQAYGKILAVDDSMAVWALRELLRNESSRQVKLLYIRVLGQIACPASIKALVNVSMQDADEEVFYASLAELVRLQSPRAPTLYVQHLGHKDNVRLNRAAHALGRLGNASCISPLIDALITTHYVILPPRFKGRQASFVRADMPDGGNPLESTAFTSNDSPIILSHTFRNEEVLQALIRLSGGVNLGFHPKAWKSWLANQHHRTSPPMHARREAAGPNGIE